MKQRRRHSYSIGRDEWLPKHIFNELGYVDNLNHKFPFDENHPFTIILYIGYLFYAFLKPMN
jgi:hypothetical protein